MIKVIKACFKWWWDIISTVYQHHCEQVDKERLHKLLRRVQNQGYRDAWMDWPPQTLPELNIQYPHIEPDLLMEWYNFGYIDGEKESGKVFKGQSTVRSKQPKF